MRTPVHFVSGEGAREWASRALAARPDWALCLSEGCPCCTGRVALQVRLARLLREQRPARVLVVTGVHAHVEAAPAAWRASPLGRYVLEGRRLCLPQDAATTAADLEASGTDEPSGA